VFKVIRDESLSGDEDCGRAPASVGFRSAHSEEVRAVTVLSVTSASFAGVASGRIHPVKRWRPLSCVILVYVGLDLCLPDMPGAFVFDPDGSVESVDIARARLSSRIAVLPSPPIDSPRLSQGQRGAPERRLPPRGEIPSLQPVMTSYLPRATCAPSPSSEDSH
jgi:hypothetical protein